MKKYEKLSVNYPQYPLLSEALVLVGRCGFSFVPPGTSHCILVNSSTVICWTSPFDNLGVLGLFCNFYSIFDGKSC